MAASHVRLAPIDEHNVKAVFHLKVATHQEAFAPSPWSLAEAVAEQRIAWPRAIVDDGEVVARLRL